MNKFKVGCLAIISCIIIIIIGICIFNYVNPNKYLTSRKSSPDFEYLGNEKYVNDNTSFKFSGFNGTWSLITFDSIKDNKITINNNSKISEGEFYVVILDSDYKAIIIDKSNKKKLEFTTSKNGKYIIRVAGKNAGGIFEMKINSSNPISISHHNIYNLEY